MTATSLVARIGYALLALPLAGVAGFYLAILVLTKCARFLSDASIGPEGFGLFMTAMEFGVIMAFSASLIGLTLPRRRPRRRTGRSGRIVFSVVFILIVTAGFAAEGHSWILNLALLVWLSYRMAFTFVRYGLLDPPGKRSNRDRVF